MAEVREGERIAKREAPAFEEIEGTGLMSGLRSHGLIGTALLDQNQFGPHGMILMLVITATLTAAFLGLMMLAI